MIHDYIKHNLIALELACSERLLNYYLKINDYEINKLYDYAFVSFELSKYFVN